MTITNIVKRRGIPTRQRTGPAPKPFSAEETEAITRMAADGIPPYVMGQRMHCSPQRIQRQMKAVGIPPVPSRGKGPLHPQWRGGRQVGPTGAVRVQMMPDDPFFVMADKSGYVFEHRLVMAQTLGRPLTPQESVHHIDGQPGHNVPSNLQLRNGRHGKHQAWRCLDCGSHNIVAVDLASGESVLVSEGRAHAGD